MQPKDWDRIASNYFKEIESPFAKGVENPLFNHLNNIRQDSSAIDLGCGIGNLIPHIKDKFTQILAVDFSEGMINHATQKHTYHNVKFSVEDIKSLKPYHNSFDYAFAINSVVEPSIEGVKTILKEIYKVLRKNGVLYAIFPAMESDILRATLTYKKELRETNSELKAIKNTHDIIDADSYDFLMGFYSNNGKQKHFYKVQLEYRLKKAGFSNIVFEKVLYPWRMCVDQELRRCREPMKLFDWFVKADKP